MSRKDKQRKAAAQAAATRGKNALHDIADRLSPLVEDASERLVPLAMDAKSRIVPLVDDAKHRLEPLAVELRNKMTPLAMDAKGRLVPLVDTASNKVSEFAGNARAQLKPLMDDAGKRIQHDVVPNVKQFLTNVKDSDQVAEAKRRGAATAAALRGDLRLPEVVTTTKRRSGRWWKLLLGGAAVIGIVVAVRRFLLGQDDGWTAHEPSEPYQPKSPGEPEVVVVPDAESVVVPDAESVVVPDAESAVVPDSESTSTNGEPTDTADTTGAGDMIDEGGNAEGYAAESTAEDSAVTSPNFGEGSYVGSEPPEGYTVKGNLRSMKYHTSETGGYERTNADVWFNSEEAATAAGFKRAQR